MTININFRTLNIVLAAGILLVLIVGGIPEYIYSKARNAVADYRDVNDTYNEMIMNFQKKNYYDKRKKQLMNEVNSFNHKTQIYQEQIISLINYHCVNNNIEIKNISFADTDLILADFEQVNESEANASSVFNVNVEFNSSIDNMLLFIDDIKNENDYIAVPRISVLTLDNNLVNVSVDLKFYFLNIDIEVIV